jgi:hypothetical protein
MLRVIARPKRISPLDESDVASVLGKLDMKPPVGVRNGANLVQDVGRKKGIIDRT